MQEDLMVFSDDFLALSEDQENNFLNSPKLSCGCVNVIVIMKIKDMGFNIVEVQFEISVEL